MPRNSLAGLDLDNLILTSRRGTAARNLPKDHIEVADDEDAVPAERSTAAESTASPSQTATPASRRSRSKAAAQGPTSQTAPAQAESSSESKPVDTPTVASKSPARTSARRATAAAAAAAVASTATATPDTSASSVAPSTSTTSVQPAASGIRKIVLKRKREDGPMVTDAPVDTSPAPVVEPLKEPTPDTSPASRARSTRSRTQHAAAAASSATGAGSGPSTSSNSVKDVAQPSSSVKVERPNVANDDNENDDDDDEEDDEQDDQDGAADDDEDDDDGDQEDDDHSDDDSDDDGERKANGDTMLDANGQPQRRHAGRPAKPPKLDANGNPIIRKRGERGRRLKPTLRELERGLKSLKAEDGSHYIDFFLELPSSEEYPDYYKHIQKPISLREINYRLRKRDITYPNPYTFITDLRLMFSNAKFYNEDGSTVWVAADKLSAHMEDVLIPQLLKFGFTLDPNDNRKTVLPKRIRDPKPPKPPKEKKITKAEQRELEKRAKAEEAAKLAAEQAAAATGGMAVQATSGHEPLGLPAGPNGTAGMDMLASIAAAGGHAPAMNGMPVYMAPPGPIAHLPFASPSLPPPAQTPYGVGMQTPQMMPHHAQVHPHSTMSPQHQQPGPLSAGPYSPQVLHQPGLPHGHSPTAMPMQQHYGPPHGQMPSGPNGPGYFPPPPNMSAPAPPGAPGPASLHDLHEAAQILQHQRTHLSPVVHPHPPMPSGSHSSDMGPASKAGGPEEANEQFTGTAQQQNNAAAREAASVSINPYCPPTVLGVRRPPVIPLIGIDVALASQAGNASGQEQASSKRRRIESGAEESSTEGQASAAPTTKFRRDLRVVLDNWLTHQHAVTLPAGGHRDSSGSAVDEIRLRFRTSPVTTKLHARRSRGLFASPMSLLASSIAAAVTGQSQRGDDRHSRVPWKWDVQTVIDGQIVEGEWRDEDEGSKGKAGDHNASAGPASQAMDVDGGTEASAAPAEPDAEPSQELGTQRKSRRAAVKGKNATKQGSNASIVPTASEASAADTTDGSGKDTSARICTLRFKPKPSSTTVIEVTVRPANPHEIVVPGTATATATRGGGARPSTMAVVVPSARLERLLERDDVSGGTHGASGATGAGTAASHADGDEVRERVLALLGMEEKYRLFITVP